MPYFSSLFLKRLMSRGGNINPYPKRALGDGLHMVTVRARSVEAAGDGPRRARVPYVGSTGGKCCWFCCV